MVEYILKSVSEHQKWELEFDNIEGISKGDILTNDMRNGIQYYIDNIKDNKIFCREITISNNNRLPENLKIPGTIFYSFKIPKQK